MKIKFVQELIDKIRYNGVIVKGQNNKIFFQNKKPKDFNINIRGDNNEIIVKTSERFACNIEIGIPGLNTNNCKITIEEGSSSNGLECVRILEDNSELYIGKNCIFSSGINIHLSDTHTIFNCNNEILNLGKSVEIGDHCWICENVTILKNTKIEKDSVVATGSVITKKFDTPNCIIAGNPAKIVKENINWDKMRPKEFLQKN